MRPHTLPEAGSSQLSVVSRDVAATGSRITVADLKTVEAKSVLDAVRRLRPEFLKASDRRHGEFTSPSVYQNDKYIGGVDELDLIPLAPVVEIRRLSAVEAKSLYGSHCPCNGGVISVRTKP